MTIEFRPTGKPHCFDLLEDGDPVGRISYDPPPEEGDEHLWDVMVWSAMGTGRTWVDDDVDSHERAVEAARELYQERVAERRELRRGSRPPTISTPMGGQKRR